MKKLESILRGCDIADKLFGLRKKQIRTAFAAARNDIEEQAARAELDYEKHCRRLGDKDVSNYKDVLNQMIRTKSVMLDAKATLDVLNEIEADLDSEATPAAK